MAQIITMVLRKSDYTAQPNSPLYLKEAITMMEGTVRLENRELLVVDFPAPPNRRRWIILANAHFWANVR